MTGAPARLGHQETDAWAAYYRHEWVSFLRAAVGMVRTGFGTDPVRCWPPSGERWSPRTVPCEGPSAAPDAAGQSSIV